MKSTEAGTYAEIRRGSMLRDRGANTAAVGSPQGF
jgi:hypothetical protein